MRGFRYLPPAIAIASAISMPVHRSAGEVSTPPVATLGRSDLAAAYMRFDTLYANSTLDRQTQREVNQRFDRITGLFFRNETTDAIRLLGELSLQIVSTTPDDAFEAALATSVMTITPDVIDRCSDEPVFLHVRSLADAPVQFMQAEPAIVRARDASGDVILALPGEIGGLPIDMTIPVPPADVLTLEAAASFELLLTNRQPATLGAWPVVCGSLDDDRLANSRRLRALGSTPSLAQAIAACASRNRLLTDSPSDARSTSRTLDLASLQQDVAGEVAAIENGRNPYANRAGDLWRTFRVGDSDIPVRIYAPEGVAQMKDAPVVIALHGAGGDENLFPDAYGAGLLKQLADERGFILASPQTRFFVANSLVFESLIDVLSDCYDIDEDRIYGVGHSLGAVALTSVASEIVDTLAGVACLAGPLVIKAPTDAPPTLLLAAELDWIGSPDRLRKYEEALQDAGATVEMRVYDDLGHTLMVNEALPDAIDWLFALQNE